MRSRPFSNSILGAGAAVLLTLGLAACGGEAEQPVEANPEAPAGISVTDGRMNLPAVAGNPGAVYFTIRNDSDQQQMIMSAYVDGAESAMLHQTETWNLQPDMQEVLQLPIPAGESLVFEPGGTHVMAMGVDETLQPGGEAEVTLTFSGGDKVSFKAQLLAAGQESADGMETGE